MIQPLLRLADALRHRARRHLWAAKPATGRRGEDLAHRLLRREGFTVVARNYRPLSRSGEIDLVAWDRDTLVFVEVKSRRSNDFGTPDRAIDREKRELLVRGAREYARRAGVPLDRVRFDVVSVVFFNPPSVSRIEDAFRPEQAL